MFYLMCKQVHDIRHLRGKKTSKLIKKAHPKVCFFLTTIYNFYFNRNTPCLSQ